MNSSELESQPFREDLPWRDIIRATSAREKAAVRAAQLVLRLPQTGDMDQTTIVHLRGVQRLYRLRETGYLDKATWDKINEMRWVDETIDA